MFHGYIIYLSLRKVLLALFQSYFSEEYSKVCESSVFHFIAGSPKSKFSHLLACATVLMGIDTREP